MKSFRTFLTEAAEFSTENKYRYSFAVGRHQYDVEFTPNLNDTMHRLDFSRRVEGKPYRSTFLKTGDMGYAAHKVLATVHSIIQHHAAAHPTLKHIRFSASSWEPSRIKLYKRYTERLGGGEYDGEREMMADLHQYQIPVNQ